MSSWEAVHTERHGFHLYYTTVDFQVITKKFVSSIYQDGLQSKFTWDKECRSGQAYILESPKVCHQMIISCHLGLLQLAQLRHYLFAAPEFQRLCLGKSNFYVNAQMLRLCLLQILIEGRNIGVPLAQLQIAILSQQPQRARGCQVRLIEPWFVVCQLQCPWGAPSPSKTVTKDTNGLTSSCQDYLSISKSYRTISSTIFYSKNIY